ncbi:MAG: type II secretion system protein GspL [Legionellales bacterium]|nr:type II secretion system protein GspL [Legionellales bacterium]
MLTCFLFIQNEDLAAILSMRMDMHGQVEYPLQVRTIEEIRALQENARTIIVFPSEWCGLYRVELPLLPDHKAREAIPYALEDHLAQEVSQVHIAFDKVHYQNGKYLVVVIDKQLMTEWMARLFSLNVDYDLITIDWFALNQGEGWVAEQSVVVDAPAFQGAISLDIWENDTPVWAADVRWQVFAESPTRPAWAEALRRATTRHTWLAERLYQTKNLNLCQGAFQHTTSQTQVKHWYQWAGILAVVWFVSFIGIHLGLYLLTTHQSQKLDQQIAKSYRVFFPGAQQVISPKIRIMQLLKKNQLGNNAAFWSLIEKFSLALVQTKPGLAHPSTLKLTSAVQTLQFQNQVLTVMFHCDDFATLEAIEAFLQKKQVHVHQVSAATENEKIVAKLELSL